MNTDTVVIKSTAMKHIEGGWPKEVDPTEKQDVTRFVTKAQKQQEYKDAVLTMGPVIARCMKQNGTCDIYEGYFDDVEDDQLRYDCAQTRHDCNTSRANTHSENISDDALHVKRITPASTLPVRGSDQAAGSDILADAQLTISPQTLHAV